jgi:hypothetical protein
MGAAEAFSSVQGGLAVLMSSPMHVLEAAFEKFKQFFIENELHSSALLSACSVLTHDRRLFGKRMMLSGSSAKSFLDIFRSSSFSLASGAFVAENTASSLKTGVFFSWVRRESEKNVKDSKTKWYLAAIP